MNGYVLGVSGSPSQNSNTDRLVKIVLESTGMETEFIKLSDLDIGPCRACMNCVSTNECIMDDDYRELSKKVRRADALVVGSPAFFGMPSGFTKAFLERLYSFRHLNLQLKGKVGAAVAVGSASEKAVADAITGIMHFQGLDVVGSVAAKGTICCSVCGVGEHCAYATWNAYCEEFTGQDFGLEEAYKDYVVKLPDNVVYVKGSAKILKKIRDAEEEPEVVRQAEELGRKIRERVESKRKE